MTEAVLQKQLESFLFDFDKADKDKSGSLSFKEVRDVLKVQGFKGSEQDAKTIFRDFDTDKNNSISRNEFGAAIKKLPKLSIREFYLRKMFNAMDRDGSGWLSYSEIMDSMKKDVVGMDIFNETTFEVLLAHSKDADGKLNYEEFLCAFKIEAETSALRKLFTNLDKDKSGFLTKDEIKAAMSFDHELQLSMTKLMGCIVHLRTDSDQKISYEEFIKLWQEESKK